MSTSLFFTKIRHRDVHTALCFSKRYILNISPTKLKQSLSIKLRRPKDVLLEHSFCFQSTNLSSKNVLYVGEEATKNRSKFLIS